MSEQINLTIDGIAVTAKPGQTVIQAAMDAGIYIPYLCYWPGMKPYGACRMCVVEIEGVRGTPASCTQPAGEGMVVHTTTPLAKDLRSGILELLLSEHPHGCLTCHRIELCGPQDICLRHVRVTDRCVVCPKNERCELKDTVRYVNMNLESPLAYNYRNVTIETKDPFYDRDYNLCIVCARCVRVCEEIRGDDAISMVDRSGTVLVGTSRGTSLLESGCEFCGACVDVCPVGALVERKYKWEKAIKSVTSTCPHCPVGCQINLEVDSKDRIIRASGDWSSETNAGQLCYKGKFGLDYVNHNSRIRTPLIRRNGNLEEATWKEALESIAAQLQSHVGDQFAFLLTPHATNEEAYTAQKFTRLLMKTNNVDITSNNNPGLFTPLMKSLGLSSSTGTLQDLEHSSSVLIVNSNTTEDHNVAAIPIKKGHKSGTLKLIVIDSREVELSRYSDIWLRPYPGTEATLIAGILKVIIEEALTNSEFIENRCENFDTLKDSVSQFTFEDIENTTGVAYSSFQRAAQYFATNGPSSLLYTLDNVPLEQQESLIDSLLNLSMITGNLGNESSGIFPLRTGTNEQGASDVGCLVNQLPGALSIEAPEKSHELESNWGAIIPSGPGIGIEHIFDKIDSGDIKALFAVGDSPQFDATALDAISKLDFLVVQDLFVSEIAQRADVVLPLAAPAEQQGTYTTLDRKIQMVNPTVQPKGDSKSVWQTLHELGNKMGAGSFTASNAKEIFNEIRSLVPNYAGITYERLETGGIQWPCKEESQPGSRNLEVADGATKRIGLTKANTFPRANSGLKEFPFLFVPGRVLAQPNEDIEIIRGESLNAISRSEAIEIHPDDARELGIIPGDQVEVILPLHKIRGKARLTAPMRGVVNSTSLFGDLATMLDQSPEPQPMLRVPSLDVMPSSLKKSESS